MSRPTDAILARAFWEALAENINADDTQNFSRFLLSIKSKIERFDAELTTSPERVQIPAESEHVALYTPPDGKIACPIPTCRAELLPGKACGGVNCGLRRTE